MNAARFEPESREESAAPLDDVAVGGDEDDGPEHRRFVIRREPPPAGRRLDRVLRERLPHASRNQLQKLIDAGGVTVNGQVPKASTKLHAGDTIDVILPPAPATQLRPEPIPLDILHEEEGFIVLNKQDDLIVHPARSNLTGTLLNGLVHHFKVQGSGFGIQGSEVRGQRSGVGGQEGKVGGGGAGGAGSRAGDEGTRIPALSDVGTADLRPGVIHRLDKHTTGVIVVAKDDEDHWKIARQFEDRKTLKAYLAVVHGNFETVGGAIDQPIGKHPTIREAQAVRHDSTGRASVTLYRVREQYRGYSLVELELRTGRTHQIRVHLSYLGHPIVGDILYGGETIGLAELDAPPSAAGARQHLNFAREKAEGQRMEAEAAARSDLLMARPALHAALLQFTHPRTGKPVTFTAPAHAPLARLVRLLRDRRIDAPVAGEGWYVHLDEVFAERDGATPDAHK